MSTTTYALVAQEKQYPLQTGKNVVGRSSVPVEGVSFINLESPLAAISRMQAFVDVAANGDAWISDCNSTNGTFLSVRPGPGVRLEANRYYQLTPGCHVIFGDVECVFQMLGNTPHTQQELREDNTATTTAARPSRKTERLDVAGSSAAVSASHAAASAPAPRDSVQRGNIPYLDESSSTSQEQTAVPLPSSTTKAASMRSSPPASSSSLSPRPAPPKKAKPESTPTSSPPARAAKAATTAVPPVVCLTGMDGDERAAITKRVRLLKGRVVDNVVKANLLVVATPPVRTPKFIIAVARGIPVVSVKYICNGEAALADPRGNGVALRTDQHTYTAAALEKVIYRKDSRPLLHGVAFNVSGLSSKTKSVATEIITASGGDVVRAKKAGALDLTDEQLDTLYDSILRGKVPKSL